MGFFSQWSKIPVDEARRVAKDETSISRRSHYQSDGGRGGVATHNGRGGLAMEMGVGVQCIKLVQEETDPLDSKTLCEMVEDQIKAQMYVQKEMQMQRQ